VFVHGVIGDVTATWKNSQATSDWPEIVNQDCKMDNYDIFSVSYNSPLIKEALTIPELSNRLVLELESKKILKNYESIVFVGHSMGNLVIRDAIWNTSKFNDVKDILLISLGAPSNGASIANLANRISDNPQFKNMVEIDYNAYLQSLNQMWLNDKKNIEIACAYETMNFPGIGSKIVMRGSATAICTRNSYRAIEANHVDMVKPRSVDDLIHQWLLLEVSKKRSLDPSIVLMDSPALIYDKDAPLGKMNSHEIEEYLRSKVEKPIDIEAVHVEWNNDDNIISRNPDAIIIHYSSFYDKTTPSDREGKLSLFLENILKNTKKTKIIIYSRWEKEIYINGALTTENMKEFLDNHILKGLTVKNKERVYAFDANKYGIRPVTFKNRTIVGKLGNYLFEILSVDTSLSGCNPT
jgi:hypothetical protein